jgi:hypothetical protein
LDGSKPAKAACKAAAVRRRRRQALGGEADHLAQQVRVRAFSIKARRLIISSVIASAAFRPPSLRDWIDAAGIDGLAVRLVQQPEPTRHRR